MSVQKRKGCALAGTILENSDSILSTSGGDFSSQMSTMEVDISQFIILTSFAVMGRNYTVFKGRKHPIETKASNRIN